MADNEAFNNEAFNNEYGDYGYVHQACTSLGKCGNCGSLVEGECMNEEVIRLIWRYTQEQIETRRRRDELITKVKESVIGWITIGLLTFIGKLVYDNLVSMFLMSKIK